MTETKTMVLLAALVAAPLATRADETSAAAPPPDLSASPPSAAPAPIVVAPATPAAPAAPPRTHGIFPLWGDKVRAKGFDLPEPFGFMTNYYYQESDIEISNLQLRFNDSQWFGVDDFIRVPHARTKGSALAIRPNVMVFPFLSVYALFSSGATETNVNVEAGGVGAGTPVQFNTLAKSGAQVVAIGTTFQMGYKGFFGVADFNASVADVERLADAVGANILSFRLGYNMRLNDSGRGVSVWAGTAGQVLDVATKGSVRLSEVLPPPTDQAISDLQARCDALGPGASKLFCNQLVQKMQDWQTNGTDATVHYSLDKKPAGVWNMILGAQFALDRSWQLRTEATFLNGRTSFLAGMEYRFDVL